ncbi:hypothetical protein NDU88_004481 [Pleurodeles waltl]|uniref:Uncharacterized protein n=1 Tax=Pleurodeles waltl TaxID=8319 RepID=A0AAV7UH85_PLEWA|nr:hypothetical protein NDU88_004481 [Pleurodeles waltl]
MERDLEKVERFEGRLADEGLARHFTDLPWQCVAGVSAGNWPIKEESFRDTLLLDGSSIHVRGDHCPGSNIVVGHSAIVINPGHLTITDPACHDDAHNDGGHFKLVKYTLLILRATVTRTPTAAILSRQKCTF